MPRTWSAVAWMHDIVGKQAFGPGIMRECCIRVMGGRSWFLTDGVGGMVRMESIDMGEHSGGLAVWVEGWVLFAAS